jgi:DeoR/GlpR family transcriptional regulator of sugar metabolism
VTGVHHEAGLTTGDPDEAAMKRTLAGRAAETYVLGSREKLGTASPYRVLPLADVTAVISDAAAEEPARRRLEEAGVPVLAAR